MKNIFVKQQLLSTGSAIALFAILSLAFLIISCGSTKKIKKPPTMIVTEMPSFKIGKTTLARGILDVGSEGTPLNPTTTFTALDKEVIAHIKLKNVSGKHKIRWDWFTPEGKLYYSTGNSIIGTKKGKYIREMTLWHKISIKDDKAEFFPGIWHVDISFDDALVSSSIFKLIVERDGIYVDTLSIATIRPNPNNWGLIVGVEKYAKLPSVEYARKDASTVKEYFEKILGIPKENIIMLLDSEATKSKIESYIKSYLPLNVNKNTLLYVYFAGHGTPSIDKGEAYLVPYDSEPRFISHTGYNLKRLYDDIGALKVKKAFVFIDGCFSGVAARGKKMLLSGARPTLIHVKDIRLKTKKVVSFTASTGEQISNSYPEKEHGLFTYFLLKGLRGPADLDADRQISCQELYKYVKTNVNKVSRGKGIEQTPIMLPAPNSVDKVTVSMVPR